MNAQSRIKLILLGLATSSCAGFLVAVTSYAGVAAAADAPSRASAAPHEHRQRVNFRDLSFGYGDVGAARGYLETIYPEGLVAASDVVADLERAGATCDGKAGGTNRCSFDDSFRRDEFVQFVTWTVSVVSAPDGALANIDLSQTLH